MPLVVLLLVTLALNLKPSLRLLDDRLEMPKLIWTALMWDLAPADLLEMPSPTLVKGRVCMAVSRFDKRPTFEISRAARSRFHEL